jgi:hypothetical protein
MNSPPISNTNQEEATSMKWGYKTNSLPLDFWKSLFNNYLESIVKRGRVFPIFVTFNMNE